MKKLSLCSVLIWLLISCSTESDFNSSKINENEISELKENLPNPHNTANPFDFKGKEYYDALLCYLKQNEYPNSTSQIADQIRFLSFQFTKEDNTKRSIIPFTDEIVESIMADPDQSMILIVQNSELSNWTKASLIHFLQGLMDRRESEFSLICAYIMNYENNVIANSSLSQDDSETILTVTSISRYSLYCEADRKDRDWDKSGANKNIKPFFAQNQVAIISIIGLLSGLD